MIYLASPYSSPIKDLEHQRFQRAEAFVAHCFRNGVWVFSPIVYAHMMAKKHSLPTDAAPWIAFNTQMLRIAEAVFVLHLPRWEESKGVALELKMASMLQIPIAHWDADFNPIVGN